MISEPIYKLKNINIDCLKEDSPLDIWFGIMIRKTVAELDIVDISRMLRQDILTEISIPLAWQALKQNPFVGEMYDGQLLELLTKYYIQNPTLKNEADYILFKKELNAKKTEYYQDDLEGKNEYEKLENEFDKVFIDK